MIETRKTIKPPLLHPDQAGEIGSARLFKELKKVLSSNKRERIKLITIKEWNEFADTSEGVNALLEFGTYSAVKPVIKLIYPKKWDKFADRPKGVETLLKSGISHAIKAISPKNLRVFANTPEANETLRKLDHSVLQLISEAINPSSDSINTVGQFFSSSTARPKKLEIQSVLSSSSQLTEADLPKELGLGQDLDDLLDEEELLIKKTPLFAGDCPLLEGDKELNDLIASLGQEVVDVFLGEEVLLTEETLFFDEGKEGAPNNLIALQYIEALFRVLLDKKDLFTEEFERFLGAGDLGDFFNVGEGVNKEKVTHLEAEEIRMIEAAGDVKYGFFHEKRGEKRKHEDHTYAKNAENVDLADAPSKKRHRMSNG